MFIGYVSNENYIALADILVEFDQDGHSVATARGAVFADLNKMIGAISNDPAKYVIMTLEVIDAFREEFS